MSAAYVRDLLLRIDWNARTDQVGGQVPRCSSRTSQETLELQRGARGRLEEATGSSDGMSLWLLTVGRAILARCWAIVKAENVGADKAYRNHNWQHLIVHPRSPHPQSSLRKYTLELFQLAV